MNTTVNLKAPYTVTSTRNMNREKWLEARMSGIGGSDAPALVLPPDVFKWKRPRDIYASKTIVRTEEQSLTCETGTYLEPFVADLFTRYTGIKVYRYRALLSSRENPFMLANIDRRVAGAREGLEIKTTSAYNERKFTDESFPYEYYIQIQHYMAVTGWGKWYLAALIGNGRFVWYEVDRNEEDIANIIETERKFWRDVVLPRNEKELELWP